jgi:S-adenosylmethionine decarboxylase
MIGLEWVVEAFDCNPAALKDRGRLLGLLGRMVDELELHPLCEPLCHHFPGPGGITVMFLLAESHLACHTYPEHRSMTLNLFCCRPRPDWDFVSRLEQELGAGHVCVRKLERRYGKDQ